MNKFDYDDAEMEFLLDFWDSRISEQDYVEEVSMQDYDEEIVDKKLEMLCYRLNGQKERI